MTSRNSRIEEHRHPAGDPLISQDLDYRAEGLKEMTSSPMPSHEYKLNEEQTNFGGDQQGRLRRPDEGREGPGFGVRNRPSSILSVEAASRPGKWCSVKQGISKTPVGGGFRALPLSAERNRWMKRTMFTTVLAVVLPFGGPSRVCASLLFFREHATRRVGYIG